MTLTRNTAASLAADLAGARVDPNEAQKALAYLRSKRNTKQFFDYLRAINQNGGAVIRSGQTLSYYRDLLAACERHLRGMEAGEMAQTLGWAIRLLRYYRAVPDAEIVRSPEGGAGLAAQREATQPQRAEAMPRPKPDEPAKPAAPQLPAVGDTFASKVVGVDENVVLVEIAGFTQEQAVGVLRAETIGGPTSRYREGNSARVEVTGVRQLKSGRTVVELKPGKRPSESKA